MNIAAGVDIGGTNTKIALINEEGQIICQASFSTWSAKDEFHFFELIYRHIQSLCQQQPHLKLIGIGIGAPSVNPKDGSIEHAANLPFKQKVEIVHALKQLSGLPVHLVKDSNASAIGEMIFGGAKGMDNFIVITLGTGLGCGIVSEGKLLTGAHGMAGEFGHTLAVENGRECGCGRKGCLETYVSATGIKRTYFHLMAHLNVDSTLEDLSHLNSRMICEGALQGDLLAKETFAFTGEILGRKFADLVACFDPACIILNGGVIDAKEILLDPTTKAMNDNLLSLYQGKVDLILSGLGANEAALLGAGALVWMG